MVIPQPSFHIVVLAIQSLTIFWIPIPSFQTREFDWPRLPQFQLTGQQLGTQSVHLASRSPAHYQCDPEKETVFRNGWFWAGSPKLSICLNGRFQKWLRSFQPQSLHCKKARGSSIPWVLISPLLSSITHIIVFAILWHYVHPNSCSHTTTSLSLKGNSHLHVYKITTGLALI